MSDSITTDALVHAGQQLAALIDQRLESGQLDPNELFELWREKSDEQIRWSLERAPAGGKFAEVLTQILEDRDDWEEHV